MAGDGLPSHPLVRKATITVLSILDKAITNQSPSGAQVDSLVEGIAGIE